MSTHALSPDCLALVSAVSPGLADAAQAGLRVRVGCSGGPDSLALAAAVAVCARRQPALVVEALVVDHQLQAGSGDIAEKTVEIVSELGLAAHHVAVHVELGGQGMEAAAREARYKALFAPGPDGFSPDIVALAHTMDDQAETVLLGLVRGSGTRSLAGMAGRVRVKSGPELWRPLLGIKRSQTVQACTDWGVDPWLDPQNNDDIYTRVRVRHNVMPVLRAQLGASVTRALARTAKLAADDADYLDELAAEILPSLIDSQNRLDAKALAAKPAALRGRLVRLWLARQEITELSMERTEAVLALSTDWHGQKGISLPGGRSIYRKNNCLVGTTERVGHQETTRTAKC